jgi:hypothetical protein
MEHREQALLRKCEDLRHSLGEKTRELSRAQELYSKLKQRVLLDRSPGSAAGQNENLRSPPVQTIRDHPLQPPAYGRQVLSRTVPLGGGAAVPDYFPSSPMYTKSQIGPGTLAGWSKPAVPHGRTTFGNPITVADISGVRTTAFAA